MRSTVNRVLQPGQLLGRKWGPLWLWFVAALTIVLAEGRGRAAVAPDRGEHPVQGLERRPR